MSVFKVLVLQVPNCVQKKTLHFSDTAEGNKTKSEGKETLPEETP